MATPPDQLPLLVEALETTTSRWARGSSPTARTCARRSRGTGGCSARRSTSSPRSGSSGRSRTRSAASRASARGRPRPVRAPADHEHRLRRRADLPRPPARLPLAVVPIRWADKRGSRMRARFGLAIRVAWDLFRIPLVHRRVGRARRPRRMTDARRRGRVPAGRCRSSPPIGIAASSSRGDAAPSRATRSASTSSPTTQRRPASTATRCTTIAASRPAGSGAVLLPAAVRLPSPAARLLPADDAANCGSPCHRGSFCRRLRSCRCRRRPAALPARSVPSCSPHLARRGRSPTPSARPWSGRCCSCCSRSGWRWLDQDPRWAVSALADDAHRPPSPGRDRLGRSRAAGVGVGTYVDYVEIVTGLLDVAPPSTLQPEVGLAGRRARRRDCDPLLIGGVVRGPAVVWFAGHAATPTPPSSSRGRATLHRAVPAPALRW